jgi:PAS domain S-box-containing protein
MTRATLRTAAEHWLAPRYRLTAIGWAPLVPREEVPAFEAEVRRELGLPDFHVIERTDADAAPRPRGDAEVFAIRYLEPAPADAHVLGLNPLSIAAARPAIEATRVDGRPAASAPFQLLHESGDRTAVVVYQALRSADGTHTLGVVFVTLRIGDTLHAVAATLPGYLQWCLVDRTSAKPLAESPGCGAASSAFVHRASIDFAGRPWDLVLAAPAAAVPDSRSWRNAWLFSIVGLCATAMLGALLLSVTGRTRRIEVAVDARTADLRREVAERARTEAALRESEQRFRNMFDHVPIGVIYTDLDGRIHEANPKLREMLGHGGTELGRMSAAELVHPSDRLAFAELAQRLVRGDITSFRRRTRFVTAGGRVIWAQVSVSLLRDEQGRPERLVGVVEDITEHLKLQEAEHARESAEAANRAKSEFVSRMSHELRTPLNAMLGFTQLLELDAQAPLAPHQVEWTSQIQQAGWHLLHMINDTLDLSRIESGALRLEIVPVHVAAVVEATCSLIEQQAERRRVRIERRLDPEAPALLGDETRIKQILTNLLSNAVKYNVDGGRVLIASRRLDEHQVEIEVHDTGIGLSGPQMAELFQPFNRLGREQYGEGTGIGLVISRRLAELMGGSLRAESKAGQGSSFRLQLPLAPAAPGAPAADLPEASGAPPDYRQRQVHYIEDNETNAEVMRGILAQRPQVHLEVWHRGLEGLAAVQQLRPHLVLLDMHLPDIDGLDLLRRLKEDPRSASVPVIVVSADATGARIEQALALGAVNYVTKPVNVADMLALLDQVLEQQETHFGADLHD